MASLGYGVLGYVNDMCGAYYTTQHQPSLIANATGALRAVQNIAVDRVMKFLDHFASTACHAREWIFGDMHRHFSFGLNAAIEAVE